MAAIDAQDRPRQVPSHIAEGRLVLTGFLGSPRWTNQVVTNTEQPFPENLRTVVNEHGLNSSQLIVNEVCT
jgi:hypothetical protein